MAKPGYHLCKCCHGSKRVPCPICEGTGKLADKSTCYRCRGERAIQCNACGGTGEVKD